MATFFIPFLLRSSILRAQPGAGHPARNCTQRRVGARAAEQLHTDGQPVDLEQRQRKSRQPEPRTIRLERAAPSLRKPARRWAGACGGDEAVATGQHRRGGALQAVTCRETRLIVTGSKSTGTVEQFADARADLLRTISRQVVVERPAHFVRDQIDVAIQLLFELPFKLSDLCVLVLRSYVDSARLQPIDESIERRA